MFHVGEQVERNETPADDMEDISSPLPPAPLENPQAEVKAKPSFVASMTDRLYQSEEHSQLRTLQPVKSVSGSEAVSYTHLTLPTIYSV